MGLPHIIIEVYYFNSVVTKSIVLQDVQGTIGRCIVNTDNLNIV